MANLKFCRICLEYNVSMYQISGSVVRDVYQRITNKKILEDGSEHYACYLCYYQLHKCKQLVTKAQRAEELLREVLTNGRELNTQSLTSINRQAHGLVTTLKISNTEFLRIRDVNEIFETEIQIKCEDGIVKKEPEDIDTSESPDFDAGSPSLLNNDDLTDCSIEDISTLGDEKSKTVAVSPTITEDGAHKDSDKDGSEATCDVNNAHDDGAEASSSDSEDDLPLEKLSSKLNVNKKKIRIMKDKVDAREVILTKKQQIEEVLERAKSAQYIKSPWKCVLCYKGFYVPNTYENHMRRHDPSSGAHVCEICKLRYRTAYLLRGHIATSHARLYKCNRCEHASHTVSQASEHERWHDGHTYDCDVCGQKFRNSSTLLSHKRKRHPSEHVCEVCGENFIGSHGLALHKSMAHSGDQQTHTGERPYSCQYCLKSFFDRRSIKNHMINSSCAENI